MLCQVLADINISNTHVQVLTNVELDANMARKEKMFVITMAVCVFALGTWPHPEGKEGERIKPHEKGG